MAVGEVEGARMFVDWGNKSARLEAIFGVCEVPPERMTWRKYQYSEITTR